jgi:glycosyltransferase involved in cell wall biosynthesis
MHVFTCLGPHQSTYEVIDRVHYHRCPLALHPDFITEMNNMSNGFVYFLGQTEAYQGVAFDIVHGHDWLAAKAVVQAKNDRHARTVLTLHSTEFGRCGNNSYEGRFGAIRDIEAEGVYCADLVITVSGALADEVKWLYGVPDWKLRSVHNGIKIVFVGDGDMKPHLEHRARELGVDHAVRFLGAMSADGDLINLFKSTDVVCVPSRNEPFGMVVLEAWAAGKPVVVTENGGPRYFTSHGEDGFVVYPNPPSICWGINTIFGNFEHARWMGERGRVKAAYGFSWEMMAGQSEGIYRELVN